MYITNVENINISKQFVTYRRILLSITFCNCYFVQFNVYLLNLLTISFPTRGHTTMFGPF